MLNIIWPVFILISVVFAILLGNVAELNNSIFNSSYETVEFIIKLFGTMCLWNGLMEIMAQTSLMNKIAKALNPIMKILFPKIKKEDKEYNEITINIIANLLGIGNAATPLGLKAMKTMQEKNKNKDILTDEMAMFIVLNTASLQIIPSTVIAIRSSMGSKNPTQIIFPVWCVTILADLAGIIACKILIKISKDKK